MLAIGAMTKPDVVGIDFGFVGDVTAMASAFDVHGYPPGGEQNEIAYHRRIADMFRSSWLRLDVLRSFARSRSIDKLRLSVRPRNIATRRQSCQAIDRNENGW